MQECSYKITDPLGIHARPAGLFVKKMQEFKSAITVTKEDNTVDGKKLLALMKLRAKQGDTVIIKAEGDDEADAIKAILAFLTENL